MTEYFKKVYIKTEDDLPANPQYLFCHYKKADRNECINYMGVEWDGEYFMSHIDWYLLPIEQKLDVPTDEETESQLWEEIALPLCEKDRKNNTKNYRLYTETLYWIKWMRDEIIKRNVKP